MPAPLDDFRALLTKLPGLDRAAAERVAATRRALPLADHALGRLEVVAPWLAAVTGRVSPAVNRPLVALFGGAHAVEEALSTRSPAALAQAFVERAGRGQAAVNQICAAGDIGLKVLDVAIDLPVGDIRTEDALDERACAATLAFGMEAVAGGPDLVCLGAVGDGGSVAIPVLLAAVLGGVWNGDETDPERKAAYETAVARAKAGGPDGFEILRRVGGRDLVALVGSILAARMERIPVILDGRVAVAAAAALRALEPEAIAHCVVAAQPETALRVHPMMIGRPVLTDLDVASGEGIASALGVGLVRNAIAVHMGLARSLQ